MNSVKKTVNRKKRTLSSTQSGAYLGEDSVLRRNQVLEHAALDSFLIRFPKLALKTHFYYKFIEDNEYVINNHTHQHWEISRICSGHAEYSVSGFKSSFSPETEQYIIIPPEMAHSWALVSSPLLIHSWQVHVAAEDPDGETALEIFRTAVMESGFIVPASNTQVQTELLLWQMSGDTKSPQLFGPVLAGFARIVIGDLFLRLNPWKEKLPGPGDSQIRLKNLAERMRLFLDSNLSHAVTLNDMESHFHYSGRHLNRIFQEVYHCPIGHYLREQRINLAKRWLSTTDRSVKDIALSLGYSSSSQFCRYFFEHTAQTPSGYRVEALRATAENIQKSIK